MGRKKASDILGELIKDVGKAIGETVKPEKIGDNTKKITVPAEANKEARTSEVMPKAEKIARKQPVVEWAPEMSVGEGNIDDQHKKLLGQINKLVDSFYFQSGLPAVRETIDFLEKYIKEHLAYEEKYMEENNYPGLERHKKIHENFVKFFNSYKKEFRTRYKSEKSISGASKELAGKARKFLGDWWINHIMNVDHQYAEYIRRNYNFADIGGFANPPDIEKAKKIPAEKPETVKLPKPAESKINVKSEKKERSKTPSEILREKTDEKIGKGMIVEKPAFDMTKIKSEIEKKLKNGGIESHEAQILMQRAPLKHAIGALRDKKELKADGKSNIQTGVPGFDELFEKGIPKSSAVIVAGGAGSGKTIFCLQILADQAGQGKKCFYMSFEESEKRLTEHMKDFGWNAEKLLKSGNLNIKRYSPFDITRSVEAMLAKEKGELLIDVDPVIIPRGFKPDFIVLDSLTAIASAFSGKEDSYRIYIEQLFRFFERLGSTAFLITETKQIPEIFSTTGVEEFLADGVIVLYNIKHGDTRENAIEVLKMRGERHQKKIVAMQITDKGIVVYPEQEVFGGLGGE